MDGEAWFGVEVRHMAALAAVAREKSFRGAADSLGYVQSAVSQRVAHLERLVGARLVERRRGSKQVQLTETGELVLAHAEGILDHLQAARADLSAHANGGESTLRLGVFPGVATGLLPRLLRRLAQRSPELRVVPVEAASDEGLFTLVESGAVDVAFGELPLDPGPFESCTVLSDPCALLVPADSEHAKAGKPPSIEELARGPLIALERWRFQGTIEAWFAAQGVSPAVEVRAESEATVRAFVAAGLGMAIMPSLGALGSDERIEVMDLSTIVPARKLALYWHSRRQYGPALRAFRDATVAVALDGRGRRAARAAPEPVALAAVCPPPPPRAA